MFILPGVVGEFLFVNRFYMLINSLQNTIYVHHDFLVGEPYDIEAFGIKDRRS